MTVPPRPGVARPLAPDPDRTERCLAENCPHCQAALASATQCGRRYRAEPPATMLPGTPFGPRIRSLLAYLHHSHHVGFERLSRLLKEVFGLTISEGAIAMPSAWGQRSIPAARRSRPSS